MNETQQIDRYIQGTMKPEEKLWMDASCMMDETLYDKVRWQRMTYVVIQHYGRQKLKEEIDQIQQRLFSETRFSQFRNKLKTIFKIS